MSKINGLTPRQLKELEEELRKERVRLERAMAAEVSSPGDGPVRRVPDSSEGGVAMALTARAHARYNAIVEAMTRLATGTYGLCARCGAGIPYGRLLALPEAAHCVACELPAA